MSAAKTEAGIYNIPAGSAFACELAAQLIRETEGRRQDLVSYRIILPTRRAAKILRDAFLDLAPGESLLLPRMHALGDVDEEELSFSIDEGTDFTALSPALPPLKRQVLLATAITRIPGYVEDFGQALLLAAALGRLMDQIYTENLSLKNLAALTIPEDLAAHWQITVKFMDLLGQEWDKILAAEQAIDGADRRNRLLQQLAENWRKSPPQTPVIAAGTTGSIPATARLLQVIAALPQGRIVLPGLDQQMDEESWQELDETHPQYGLKLLLEGKDGLGVKRADIRLWPGCDPGKGQARRLLGSEIMRPPATTSHWTEKLPSDKAAQQSLKTATENLKLLTCANEREEAAAIAVLLRGALETPGRTAAVITPRRSLARRIAAACRRWDIVLDDSAGRPLGETLAGSFFRLLGEAGASNFTPVALLALLKHPFVNADNIALLDKELRGPRPPVGLKGILERDKAGIMRSIAPILQRFMTGSDPEKPRKFSEILAAHLEAAESLAGGPDLLWSREDGEAAALFFADLTAHSHLFPSVPMASHANILAALMENVTVRPAFGTHPRLRILGQLEARMTDADLVIMAGLNEKSWPPEAGFDPWMSRPMRKSFGLPGPERRIGLAAHDFVQAFCAPEVVLTRSIQQDGAPAVPARWLQRLDAVLTAAGIPNTLHSDAAQNWASGLDESAAYEPVSRPEPRPPAAARPRQISVTNVERWQKDPYGIYAKYILELRKMDELEESVDAAEKGNLLHRIMHRFTAEVPAEIPKDAKLILTRIAGEEIAARGDDPSAWSFWQRRFDKTADWLVRHETGWRRTAHPARMETEGETVIAAKKPFTLTAIADRIDTVPGGAAVIDYKSGSSYNKSEIEDGRRPQLPLEGLILSKGGFKELGPLKPVSLQYWKLTGSIKPDARPAGISGDLSGLIEQAEASLITLVNIFDNEKTPYYSLPRLDNRPSYNDYEHLARVREWTALGEDESAEAA